MITDEQAKTNIGANVSKLRANRSRSWLAREVGTYPINITRIEAGEHMPGSGLLSRLAEALKTTSDALLGRSQKKSRRSG